MKESKEKAQKQTLIFTPTRLDKIEPDPEKRSFYWDEKQPCLRLQVTQKGVKSFQFYIWHKVFGQVNILIGHYPKIDIDTARKLASQWSSEIATEGVSAIEKLKGIGKGGTFHDKYLSYIEKRKDKLKDIYNTELRYKTHIQRHLGNMNIDAITEVTISKWVKKLYTTKAKDKDTFLSPTTINRCIALVKAVFNSECDRNPASKIKMNKEFCRDRYLRPHETRKFWEAVHSEETPEYLRDLVILALTTGARKANLLSMQWEDINLDNREWIIKSEKSKSGRPMLIPLEDVSMSILQRRYNVKGRKKYVFMGHTSKDNPKEEHLKYFRKPWVRLLERADIKEFHFHDLRRTLGSYQVMTNASLYTVSKTLGHQNQSTTERYAHIGEHDIIRESKKRAFEEMTKDNGPDLKEKRKKLKKKSL